MEVPNRAAQPLSVRNFTASTVHVWHASLEQPTEVVTHLGSFLSDEERKRSERFYFDRDRQFFIVSRGILRVLLSQYTDTPPGDIQFNYTFHGKPYLRWRPDLCFNLSHSGRLVMYAFSPGCRVGIDIEFMHPIEEMGKIAERNFSTQEYEVYKSVAEADRVRAFFDCWTRKEAFIKAIGEGTSFPLQDFVVSLKQDEPAQLLSIRGSQQQARQWSMHELEVENGYTAALVIEGKGHSILRREWTLLPSVIKE